MRLRKAEKSDFDFFYKIKSEETNIFWTGWDKKPEYASLLDWFNKVIDESVLPNKKKIYIAEESIGGGGILLLATFILSPWMVNCLSMKKR